MSENRNDWLKDSLLGHQFVATIFAQAFTGNPDISFMPEVERPLIPFDKTEGWFKAMAEAEAAKRNGQ